MFMQRRPGLDDKGWSEDRFQYNRPLTSMFVRVCELESTLFNMPIFVVVLILLLLL